MNVQQMREQRATHVASMREILQTAEEEERELTAEEIEQYDELGGNVESLTASIERAERQASLEADLDQPAPAVASGNRPSGQGQDGPRNAPAPEASREFESLGHFVATVARNPNDQRLASLYQEFDADGRRSEQRMDEGSAGGFAVPTQFRATLMEVSPQEARIRPRATTIPAGTPPDSAVTMPALDQTGETPDNVYGGVTVNWIGEGAEKPETDADLREIKLEPQEVAGYTTLTDKLLRNWPAASAVIERLLRGAVISAEEFAFLSGNGVAKPLGLVNAGATYKVNRGTANQIKRADINAMTSRILMRGGMPVWLASQSIIPQLQNLRNEVGSPPVGDGALVWDPDMRDSANNQLLGGYPILWNERSPQLGSLGDLVLADLSYYLVKDGSGPFVAASPHVKFTSNKTVVKVFWNVDGQPWMTEPFKQEGGYEVSPFVALDVPAG
ncbi:MAG TPA: phage major capsid protein [Arenicellales bacterium]|nr:phage major capsid protein [Arenicellales bacterium]